MKIFPAASAFEEKWFAFPVIHCYCRIWKLKKKKICKPGQFWQNPKGFGDHTHCATFENFIHLLLLHKSLYKTISRYFAGFSVFFGTLGYRGQGMINISSGFWAEGVENLSWIKNFSVSFWKNVRWWDSNLWQWSKKNLMPRALTARPSWMLT